MRESSERSDVFLGDISSSGSVVFDSVAFALADSINFFVSFGSVVVSELTSSSNGPSNSSWMPSSDTSDLSVTSVRLLLQVPSSEPLHDTGESLTLGDSNNINTFVLSKHLVDSNFLLEESVAVVYLFSNIFSSVDLNLEDVVLLLSQSLQEVELSVADSSNDCAVLFDSVQLDLNFLGTLGDSVGILSECLLLGSSPVLVESSESVLLKMSSPDSSQSSESSWSFDVADETNNSNWWGLDNSDSLNNLLLVHFGTSSVNLSENMGHASLESSKSGEMTGLGLVVSGERSYPSPVVFGSSSGHKPKMTLSGAAVLPVRHVVKNNI